MTSNESSEFIFSNYDITNLTLSTDEGDISSGVHLKVSSDIKTYQEEKKVVVMMNIKMSSQDNPKRILLSITSHCSFLYKGNEILKDADSQSILKLINITYDTTRGVIIEKFANSKFQKLILPIASDEALGISPMPSYLGAD